MVKNSSASQEPIVIKKYANRRLYNTASSSYVTLDNLCQMVKDGVDFVVYDAKTGEDITRSVLTQIIFEEEAKGQNLLPISFLRQLIGLYGDSLEKVVPDYLEMSMQAFARNQEQMRKAMNETFSGVLPFKQFEEMGRQNLALFQEAMKMLNPMASRPSTPSRPEEEAPSDKGRPAGGSEEGLAELKEQLAAMQRQLDKLAGKK